MGPSGSHAKVMGSEPEIEERQYWQSRYLFERGTGVAPSVLSETMPMLETHANAI